MKVALVVHCYFPLHFHGTETYTASVARNLREMGHQPTVVTATPAGDPPQERIVIQRQWEGVDVISIDRNAMPSRSIRDSYDFPALKDIATEVLRRLRPDIVHVCHLVNHTTAAPYAARALGLPLVATLTDYFGYCYTESVAVGRGRAMPGPEPHARQLPELLSQGGGGVRGSVFRLAACGIGSAPAPDDCVDCGQGRSSRRRTAFDRRLPSIPHHEETRHFVRGLETL